MKDDFGVGGYDWDKFVRAGDGRIKINEFCVVGEINSLKVIGGYGEN
ncbi:hypothetical protein [Staphylococcus aureus]|nr:hypothetical protein [Staphylococcus aureus]